MLAQSTSSPLTSVPIPPPKQPFDALILHVGSQMSLLTTTLLPDLVMFNVYMMPHLLPWSYAGPGYINQAKEQQNKLSKYKAHIHTLEMEV